MTRLFNTILRPRIAVWLLCAALLALGAGDVCALTGGRGLPAAEAGNAARGGQKPDAPGQAATPAPLPPPSLVDSVMLRVYFHRNKTRIDPKWMGNEQHMREFAESMRRLLADSAITTDEIYLSANASLEGPLWNNNRLARERARVVAVWMEKELGLNPGTFKIRTEGEDWEFFRQLAVSDTALPYRARVLSIINTPLEGRKERMQALGKGVLFEYLLKTHYRSMRCTAVRMAFEAKQRINPMPPMKAPEAMRWPMPEAPAMPAPLPLPHFVTPATKPLRYPLLAVKTNLAYYFLNTRKTGWQPAPNVEAEWYSRGGRWAVSAEFVSPWRCNWEEKTFFQIQTFEVMPRWYFKKDRRFTGHYLGLYARYSRYDICVADWDGNGYQGEAGGAGLAYGYVLPLGNRLRTRWTMQFTVKAGFYKTYYDPYVAGDPYHNRYYYDWDGTLSEFRKRNWTRSWFGPTGVGISISYDLLKYKR